MRAYSNSLAWTARSSLAPSRAWISLAQVALTSLIVQELSIAFADSFGSLGWAFRNVVILASSKLSCLATSSHSEATVTTSHKDFVFPSFLYWSLPINFILGRSSATWKLVDVPYTHNNVEEHDYHLRRIGCEPELPLSGTSTPDPDDSKKYLAAIRNKHMYALLVYKNYL